MVISTTYKRRFIFIVTFVMGLLISCIDSRPGWDDSGISASMVFGISALAAFLSPERPWVWALITGIWIPLYGIIFSGNIANDYCK
jgi:hypothetical protein